MPSVKGLDTEKLISYYYVIVFWHEQDFRRHLCGLEGHPRCLKSLCGVLRHLCGLERFPAFCSAQITNILRHLRGLAVPESGR